MQKTWIDPTFEAGQSLIGCAYEIEGLANAFYDTGNTKVSDKLFLIADSIRHSEKTIREAIAEHVQDDLRQSQQGVADIFTAFLAGFPKEAKAD